jgi:hypothetical protein
VVKQLEEDRVVRMVIIALIGSVLIILLIAFTILLLCKKCREPVAKFKPRDKLIPVKVK